MSETSRTRVLKNLFNVESFQNELDWQPFRPGVEIFLLSGDMKKGPASALLRYQAGAGIPQHQHPGFEHVLILSKSQTDERGRHVVGTLVVNPPGSRHTISTEEGCIVLVIWEKPVQFFATTEAAK